LCTMARGRRHLDPSLPTRHSAAFQMWLYPITSIIAFSAGIHPAGQRAEIHPVGLALVASALSYLWRARAQRSGPSNPCP
jgi:hypothetical protein